MLVWRVPALGGGKPRALLPTATYTITLPLQNFITVFCYQAQNAAGRMCTTHVNDVVVGKDATPSR